RKVSPTGGTDIGKGIREARRHLEGRPAGRYAIILVTDGETKETPEEIRAEIAQLKDITLFVLTTKKEVPGARNVPIGDWTGLRKELENVSHGMQDLRRDNPGPVQFAVHPATAGFGALSPAWINRTTAKPGAQVVATVGRAPQDPVLAFGQAG